MRERERTQISLYPALCASHCQSAGYALLLLRTPVPVSQKSLFRLPEEAFPHYGRASVGCQQRLFRVAEKPFSHDGYADAALRLWYSGFTKRVFSCHDSRFYIFCFLFCSFPLSKLFTSQMHKYAIPYAFMWAVSVILSFILCMKIVHGYLPVFRKKSFPLQRNEDTARLTNRNN